MVPLSEAKGKLGTLKWGDVEWPFLIAVVATKTTVFAATAALTFLLQTKQDKVAFAKAGLYGLFVTQSNDFALGLPIIKGIFGEVHPNYIGMFYLTGKRTDPSTSKHIAHTSDC